MPAHIEDLNDWQVDHWPSTPEGEARQAREVAEMYETLFAHPLVEAITTWDAVDGKWLGAPSGLLRADNSPKPAYEALRERICGTWCTRETLTTDAEGRVRVRGYQGDYALQCGDAQGSFLLARDGQDEVIVL